MPALKDRVARATPFSFCKVFMESFYLKFLLEDMYYQIIGLYCK